MGRHWLLTPLMRSSNVLDTIAAGRSHTPVTVSKTQAVPWLGRTMTDKNQVRLINWVNTRLTGA